ncbi:hypothetical protein [Streptomyces sp. C8S0]|uniref:hypothetical protein n=1 Tax=Streptomyces sp. C8S0 TaxID=2585716 RepID=UPI001D056D04|nr:hypothetical protein [Streptomyces sp. C8S0]
MTATSAAGSRGSGGAVRRAVRPAAKAVRASARIGGIISVSSAPVYSSHRPPGPRESITASVTAGSDAAVVSPSTTAPVAKAVSQTCRRTAAGSAGASCSANAASHWSSMPIRRR